MLPHLQSMRYVRNMCIRRQNLMRWQQQRKLDYTMLC
jgi:hypothetical protein